MFNNFDKIFWYKVKTFLLYKWFTKLDSSKALQFLVDFKNVETILW